MNNITKLYKKLLIINQIKNFFDLIKKQSSYTTGYTILELLLVIAILAILMAVGSTFLFGQKLSTELNEEGKRIVGVLRSAQNKAITMDQRATWGIHFDNITSTEPFYDVFWGNTYLTGTTTDRYYLSSGTMYDSPISGSSTNVIFQKRSGELVSGATSTIVIKTNVQNQSSTIIISPAGRIIIQ